MKAARRCARCGPDGRGYHSIKIKGHVYHRLQRLAHAESLATGQRFGVAQVIAMLTAKGWRR